jgi:hypothetical protein
LRAITEFVSIAVAAITVLGTTLLSAILMLESIPFSCISNGSTSSISKPYSFNLNISGEKRE